MVHRPICSHGTDLRSLGDLLTQKQPGGIVAVQCDREEAIEHFGGGSNLDLELGQ
jgi:hypothetical protein